MMKKFFSIASLALLAASMLMTGCKKENDGNVFRLKIQQYQGQGKTTLGDNGATLWVDGDQVYVNGDVRYSVGNQVSRYNQPLTITVDANGIASTTVPSTLNPNSNGKYLFFYPGLSSYTANSTQCSPTTFVYSLSTVYNQWDATNLQSPMVGVSNGQNVTFYNFMSMLKIELPYPINVNGNIVIESEDTPISGPFKVTYENNDWSVEYIGTTTGVPSDAHRQITIKGTGIGDATVLYVPIPAGNHKLTISGNFFKKEMTTAHTLQKNTIYPINFCNLPKTFSLSSGKKVHFASSNLKKDGSSYTFTSYPWEHERNNNGLFFLNYNCSATNAPESSGTSVSVGGETWYVPTSEEWDYLLGSTVPNTRDHRDRSNAKCQPKIVHGVNGIVILPDNFVMPQNISWSGFGTGSSYTDLSNDEWSLLANNGAIFLPSTGFMQFNLTNETLNNYTASTNSDKVGYYAGSSDAQTFLSFSKGTNTFSLNPYQNPGSAYRNAVAFRLYQVVNE